MILYSFVDCAGVKPRYYLNYGEMVYDLITEGAEPTPDTFFPFNPDIQKLGSASADATEANKFLRRLYPYPNLDTNIWPFPIYGNTDAERENNLILRVFLVQYMFPKYWELFILPWAEDESADEQERVYRVFFNRFMQLMVATFNKYLPIIKAYKDKESKLLDRLASHSESITKFNDTPQDGGDFSDDNHTTNATRLENDTASDYETPIKRLSEIKEKYENVYNAWALEFDILFTKGDTGEL